MAITSSLESTQKITNNTKKITEKTVNILTKKINENEEIINSLENDLAKLKQQYAKWIAGEVIKESSQYLLEYDHIWIKVLQDENTLYVKLYLAKR